MNENFPERLSIVLSNKTRMAMLTHLRKYGGGAEDISQFIEDAVIWRLLDRQSAIRHFLATADNDQPIPQDRQDPDLLSA